MKRLFLIVSSLFAMSCARQSDTLINTLKKRSETLLYQKNLKNLQRFGVGLNAERKKRGVPLIGDELLINYRYSYDNMQLLYDAKEMISLDHPIHWRKVVHIGGKDDSLLVHGETDIYRKLIREDSLVFLNIGYSYYPEKEKPSPWHCIYSGFKVSDENNFVNRASQELTLEQADSVLTAWRMKRK